MQTNLSKNKDCIKMQFNLNFSGAKHSISLPITKGSKEKKKEKTGRLAHRKRKYFKKSLKQQTS